MSLYHLDVSFGRHVILRDGEVFTVLPGTEAEWEKDNVGYKLQELLRELQTERK